MPPPIPHPCRLFLFDLDGTLIDSKEDIAKSVNLALVRLQQPRIPEARIIEFVGDGISNLMQQALHEASGLEPEPDAVHRSVEALMLEYENHLLDSTRLYPGVQEALDALWWGTFGVVSNKPEGLSRRVLDGLGLAESFCVILGGDSLPQRKPDPAPLLKAMACCGAEAAESVMIGDSPADIYAGKAAGLTTCGFSGGFRSRSELLEAGCDFLVENLTELTRLFCAPPHINSSGH
jgi:phosphoglycolate phosphatase